MTAADLPRRRFGPPPRPPAWAWQCALGFAYWLVFLLVLEPGNLKGAVDAGEPLRLGDEALRIVVAAAMGAAVTPVLVGLARRFPIEGTGRWRHAAMLVAAIAALAFGLIVVSCFPAAWFFDGRPTPLWREVTGQLTANWLLLIYCMAAFVAVAQLARGRSPRTGSAPPDPARIAVRSRGRVNLVDLAEVDWIEAQGNYVALHVGTATHLVRTPFGRFEAGLDQARFARIHRRAIVALDRAAGLRPLANGDAMLRLADGRELRVSRSYRPGLAERLAG